MKKPTSNSVFGAKKTSSRSGTPKKMDGTAELRPKPDPVLNGGKYSVIAHNVRAMSEADFRQSLVEAGIIDSGGELKSQYKR